MKIGTISYVPPVGVGNAEAFLKNLAAHKTAHPLYLYSDHPWKQVDFGIADPTVVRTGQAPWAISNCVWLFGLKLAADMELDYFMYLEADCRVRSRSKELAWDEILFNDFFDTPGALFGGSPVVYFPSESGADVLSDITKFCAAHLEVVKRPVPIYGTVPGRAYPLCLYPNGAGGIYHTKTMLECFSGFLPDIGRYSQRITAWDIVIGQEMFKKFRRGVISKFAPIASELSAYGDSIYGLDARMNMLTSGTVNLVHQIKSAWDGSTDTKKKYEHKRDKLDKADVAKIQESLRGSGTSR